jgi:DeoR/GlpR family transcriptional regulator of sugar metabolism
MIYFERKEKIMSILYQKGSVTISELVQTLGASIATIRRDLTKLVEEGLITRYRGGVTLPDTGYGHEPPLKERGTKNLDLKKIIGETAADLIKGRETIGIDIGTTTLELAKALLEHNDLTIFTYSIPIVYMLSHSKINVYLTGGLLNPKELCLGGSIPREIIKQYHFDKFFLGAAAIDEKGEISDFGIDEIEIKRTFIENSREIILLIDSSKFGKKSFKTICSLEKINTIVTDENIDPKFVDNFSKKGVKFIIARNRK